MSDNPGISFADVLEMAIALEQRGAAFYSRAAALSREPYVKRFFNALVEVEERHELEFRKLRAAYSGSGTLDSPHDPGGQRARVTRRWTHGQIFDRHSPTTIATDLTLEEIVLQAIKFEEETAEFYRRIKPFLSNPRDLVWVDKTIHEELTHARSLERVLQEVRTVR